MSGPDAATGPLVVSEANPRYFTVADEVAADRKAVYLTGSHIWNNLHDGLGPGASCADTPEQNDYRAYLDFLSGRGHNFIRLWRWEHFRSQAHGGGFHLCMTPQPWPPNGTGSSNGREAEVRPLQVRSGVLVLQPSETAAPFTATLEAGTYTVEWFSVDSRETMEAGKVTVERSTTISFSAPFDAPGPAVLYLRKVGR